ncbi:hypothetical protein [Microbulbifer litoralis]|uniref:hypothetical protein n=1 Tax=Microbulbifer litoralis TaxID=2933965 RepID=UPI0020287CCD|nr:hypothetical protein [Microbulbifer sp. GX H0434]
MRKLIVGLLSLIFVGCATTYKGPETGELARIHFKLEEGLKDGPTVSVFEGLECSPSEYGEYIGDLWDGNWTEPSTLEFTVNVPANKMLSFEFFQRTEFTGEMVLEGQFCRNIFAFVPESGAHYTFTYGNCDYKGINTKTKEAIKTQKPIGKCHSSRYFGAY